jgi:hypothetical protein
VQGQQQGRNRSEVLRQDGLGLRRLRRRQEQVHLLSSGIGPQQAHVIQAALDGMAEGVGGCRNRCRIGEGQGTASRTDEMGSPGQMSN